jgi:hypothetical protein
MKIRRAASLLELLLVMSACTVVLTMTGVLLNRAMRIQIQSRAQESAERAALRLSRQFRDDVHRGRLIPADKPGQDKKALLRLQFADGRTVEYSRDSGGVLRLESGGSRPAWREEFSLSSASMLTIEQRTQPARLALTVESKPIEPAPGDAKPPASMNALAVSLYAEAVIGRDLRFGSTTSEEAQK